MVFTQENMTNQPRVRASETFRRLQGQATLGYWWATLMQQPHGLLSLTNVEKQLHIARRAHAGLRQVPIKQIRGSENRSEDFDQNFRPLRNHNKDRWVEVALAHHQDVALPAVELVQIRDIYYVRDGHHRISVAKSFGQLEIEANVTVWHATNEQMQ